MERRITCWFSHNLNAEMPLVAYGHAGQPLLMFPTAAADYLEYERFLFSRRDKAARSRAGVLRAYSINSVNKYSLLNEKMPPKMKAELLTRFDRYITDEVLPLIRNEAGPMMRVRLTTGASLGRVSRGERLLQTSRFVSWRDCDERQLRRAFLFEGLLRRQRLLQQPGGLSAQLKRQSLPANAAKGRFIYILSGQGNYEAPERSQNLSDILNAKSIPHKLDLWGADVDHDWPWWRKMLPYTLGVILAKDGQ